MSTFTWNSTNSVDWNTVADWTRTGGTTAAPPGNSGVSPATDVATIAATTAGSPFTVSIATGETFDIATLNYSSTTTSGAPTLSITGTLRTNTFAISGTKTVTTTINAGGIFDIRTGITNASSTAETITIAANNAGAVQSGGHLELGSLTVDQSAITYSFNNLSTTKLNTGQIEFLSGFAIGQSTSQHISSLAWGDTIVFDGANFAGDTAALNTTSHVLTVKSGTTTVFTMNNVTLATGAGNSFQVFGSTIEVVCFAAGSRILTATGEKTVESLTRGDIVLTLADGELRPQPVKWIGQRRLDLKAHPRPKTVAPVRVKRDAIADNMPHTDLLLSPDHGIFIDGKLVCVRQLINGSTIRQEEGWSSVEYFHVELDAHAILVAEGLPTESYLNTGNSGFFAASEQPLVLYPDLTSEADYPTRELGSCAPFVWDESSVLPVWQKLADRAGALGQPAPKLEVTNDPDLHIFANGRRVRPLYSENGLHIFALPKKPKSVRLVSRAAAPTDSRPWLEDRRDLGVYVERIVLRSASDLQDVPLDDPELTQGWWAVERSGTAMRRWTDGNALLHLPVIGDATMLEIRATNAGMVYPVSADRVSVAA